jgi:hypothetical protein
MCKLLQPTGIVYKQNEWMHLSVLVNFITALETENVNQCTVSQSVWNCILIVEHELEA